MKNADQPIVPSLVHKIKDEYIVDLEGQKSYNKTVPGLTKREYFAGLAMQGILAANPKETWGNIEMPVAQHVAELSIDFADELLKQLDK